MPALCLTTRQTSELNACWNNVIRRLFGFNKWESVSAMLLGLGRLNINHLIMLRKVRFYRHLLHSCDIFLCNVFLVFFSDNFNNDCVLWTLFLPTSEATESVWKAFENYVTDCCSFLACCSVVYNLSVCLSYCLVWRINVFTSLASCD